MTPSASNSKASASAAPAPAKDSEDAPKVTLALADNELRRRMTEMLDRTEVEVRTLRPDDELWQKIEVADADLVLVWRAHLPDDHQELVEALAGGDDSPGVVVVNDSEDPAEHARLMAAGAAGVVGASAPREVTAETVEKLAAAEQLGGVDGPEVRGNEAEPLLGDFLSRNPAMGRFTSLAERVADSDTSILITGETGVGKERLARAIHNESPRSSGPFVSVNCGALPEQLLESELFGHVAGAFTGADADRRGRFELAVGGTLFLDEIGEMPPHLQVRLLTVLQRHEVTPVGSETTIPVNVRILAATNRNPEDEVAAGRLREDLYYRLNVVTLVIPPLRERPEDIPDLLGRFIHHFSEVSGRRPIEGVEKQALNVLLRYSWPGNVRELINVVERAMLVCRGSQIECADLPEELLARESGVGGTLESTGTLDDVSALLDAPLKEVRQRAIDQMEARYLEAQLQRHEGSIAETAAAAGISTRALYDKMKKHGLQKEHFYPSSP